MLNTGCITLPVRDTVPSAICADGNHVSRYHNCHAAVHSLVDSRQLQWE